MMKKSIVFIILLLTILFVFGIYINNKLSRFDPLIETTIIHFPRINKNVYFTAKAWGIAGNHEEIILSENKSSEINKKKDYVFYTPELYYKNENEKLSIYVTKNLTNLPVEKFNQIEIEIIDVKTADELQDFKRNYKSYGLKKITAY